MAEYKMVRLGDVCEIQSGGTPSRSKTEYWKDGTIPWVKIGDFSGKYLDKTTEHITQQGLDNSSAKLFSKGTILYSIFATLGEATILNIDATTNQAIAGIKIKDKSSVDIDYFYSFLKSLKDEVNRIGRGVAQNNINLSILKSFFIPLPPLETQKQIAAQLDKCTAVIAKHKQMLEKYDTLIKSRFIEMFGDILAGKYKFETRKLGEISEVGSSHRVFTTEFVEHGIPFYRGTEIGELANGKIPQKPYYISEEHYQRLIAQDSKPQIGDLLMPSICNKGQVWMVDTEEPFYYKDGRVLSISPNREIYNSKYLQYFMREKTLVEYPKLGSGSTFAEFKIFLLKDIDILTPPLSLQNDFASFVQQIDKSKFAVQKSLEKTETLYKSLMQQYFA